MDALIKIKHKDYMKLIDRCNALEKEIANISAELKKAQKQSLKEDKKNGK